MVGLALRGAHTVTCQHPYCVRRVWGFRKVIARSMEDILEGFRIRHNQPILLRDISDDGIQQKEGASLTPMQPRTRQAEPYSRIHLNSDWPVSFWYTYSG